MPRRYQAPSELSASLLRPASALRAALREDPDVIAITELRDRESMRLALSAAETGHLVLGTLHTGNAGQTISRIVNAFPAEEQGHIRGMLSESLRAVVSQRLAVIGWRQPITGTTSRHPPSANPPATD